MNEAMRGLLFNERFSRMEPPDYDFPSCGAADEYGRPIMCWQCIHGGHCALQPFDMEDDDGDK